MENKVLILYYFTVYKKVIVIGWQTAIVAKLWGGVVVSSLLILFVMPKAFRKVFLLV